MNVGTETHVTRVFDLRLMEPGFAALWVPRALEGLVHDEDIARIAAAPGEAIREHGKAATPFLWTCSCYVASWRSSGRGITRGCGLSTTHTLAVSAAYVHRMARRL